MASGIIEQSSLCYKDITVKLNYLNWETSDYYTNGAYYVENYDPQIPPNSIITSISILDWTRLERNDWIIPTISNGNKIGFFSSTNNYDWNSTIIVRITYQLGMGGNS